MNPEQYLAALSPVRKVEVGIDPAALELCRAATAAIGVHQPIDQRQLAAILADHPEYTEVVATVVGLSREALRTWLKGRFDTAGWVKLARLRSEELVDALEADFALMQMLNGEMHREWTWADALAYAMGGRHSARGSVAQGRALEDEVEMVLGRLQLTYAPRGRFVGVDNKTAPADFVITDSSGRAHIAVAVKGFDSTGSKLTDARREIEEMAAIREPGQFVFAFVDGLGWKRRQSDLARIIELAESRKIAGVYCRQWIDAFEIQLRDAAVRSSLLSP